MDKSDAVRLLMQKKPSLAIEGGKKLFTWVSITDGDNSRYDIYKAIYGDGEAMGSFIAQIRNRQLMDFAPKRVNISKMLCENNFNLKLPISDLDYFLFLGQIGDIEMIENYLQQECDDTRKTLIAIGASIAGHIPVLEYLKLKKIWTYLYICKLTNVFLTEDGLQPLPQHSTDTPKSSIILRNKISIWRSRSPYAKKTPTFGYMRVGPQPSLLPVRTTSMCLIAS